MSQPDKISRMPGFHKLGVEERLKRVAVEQISESVDAANFAELNEMERTNLRAMLRQLHDFAPSGEGRNQLSLRTVRSARSARFRITSS